MQDVELEKVFLKSDLWANLPPLGEVSIIIQINVSMYMNACGISVITFVCVWQWLCVIPANHYKDAGISIIRTMSVIINC